MTQDHNNEKWHVIVCEHLQVELSNYLESTLSLRFYLINGDNLDKVPSYIDVPKNSTYDAANTILRNSIGGEGHSPTLLVQSYGPWPCWRFPKPDEKISFETSTLLAVDNNKPFIIALLRTEVEDKPLMIDWGDHASSTSLDVLKTSRQILHDKGLTLRSAQLYGSFETIKDQVYDFSVFANMESFPTTLYLLARNSSIADDSSTDETYQFRTECKATTPILMPFQMALRQSNRIMNNIFKLQLMELQCLHISQALLHLVITLDDGEERMEQLHTNDDLQRIMDHFEVLIGTLSNEKTTNLQISKLEEDLVQVFCDCCGEFPGAVAVRYSYNVYQKMVRLDHKNFERRKLYENSMASKDYLDFQPAISGLGNSQSHHGPTFSPPVFNSSDTTFGFQTDGPSGLSFDLLSKYFPVESNAPLPLLHPVRTAFGNPNGAFVQGCFCHLHRERANYLRAVVQYLIDQQWWRHGDRPPSITCFDHFVDETNTGMFQCLFCMAPHPDLEAAHACIERHLNIAS
ncbi:hypothetical protein CPB86DRAFT_875027 [Serendipita vermifera]|nr:hypothetical protein CPB86DRAFT_875027 [Serendipita vermifera]